MLVMIVWNVFRGFENLRELSFCWFGFLDNVEFNVEPSTLLFPNLTSLDIQVFTPTESVLENVMVALSENQEAKIRRLSINFHCPVTLVVTGQTITETFPHLKVLEIQQWGGVEEDYHHMFDNLPTLEELSFRNCVRMGDGIFTSLNKKGEWSFGKLSSKAFMS